MLDKYIKINDKVILSGQDGKTGVWYCKELPAETTKETDILIGELNRIYNKYNKTEQQKQKKQSKKPEVKGLE